MFPKETKVLSVLKPVLKSKIKSPSEWWKVKVNFCFRNSSCNYYKQLIGKKNQLVGCFFLPVWCGLKHRQVSVTLKRVKDI